jgi:hypothetical protein
MRIRRPIIAAPPSLAWAYTPTERAPARLASVSIYKTLIERERLLYDEFNRGRADAEPQEQTPVACAVAQHVELAANLPVVACSPSDEEMIAPQAQPASSLARSPPDEEMIALPESPEESAHDMSLVEAVAELDEVLEALDADWADDVVQWMKAHDLAGAFSLEQDTLRVYTNVLSADALCALRNLIQPLAEASAARASAEVGLRFAQQSAKKVELSKMLMLEGHLKTLVKLGGNAQLSRFLEWAKLCLPRAFSKICTGPTTQFVVEALSECEVDALNSYLRMLIRACSALRRNAL